MEPKSLTPTLYALLLAIIASLTGSLLAMIAFYYWIVPLLGNPM